MLASAAATDCAWKRGEREGVEKHQTAWPCNEDHRTAPREAVRLRGRHTDTHTHRERETERQRGREAERQKDREGGMEGGREGGRERSTEAAGGEATHRRTGPGSRH